MESTLISCVRHLGGGQFGHFLKSSSWSAKRLYASAESRSLGHDIGVPELEDKELETLCRYLLVHRWNVYMLA